MDWLSRQHDGSLWSRMSSAVWVETNPRSTDMATCDESKAANARRIQLSSQTCPDTWFCATPARVLAQVKGLGQIYEDHVEVLMLFSTLLLYLSWREDHVHGASSCSEPTLTLRYDAVVVNMSIKQVQQDTC